MERDFKRYEAEPKSIQKKKLGIMKRVVKIPLEKIMIMLRE